LKLLDTTVLIDIDKGGSEVIKKVEKLDAEGRHAISVITLYEFYWGIYRKYKKGSKKYNEAIDKAEKLFARFKVFPITPDLAIKAAEIGTSLISKFEKIDGLNIEKW